MSEMSERCTPYLVTGAWFEACSSCALHVARSCKFQESLDVSISNRHHSLVSDHKQHHRSTNPSVFRSAAGALAFFDDGSSVAPPARLPRREAAPLIERRDRELPPGRRRRCPVQTVRALQPRAPATSYARENSLAARSSRTAERTMNQQQCKNESTLRQFSARQKPPPVCFVTVDVINMRVVCLDCIVVE
jgi:hypothetical protein